MSKNFWLVIVAIIVVLIGIFAITSHGSNTSTNLKPTNHVEGLGKDGVKLVEWGDYQCPYCWNLVPFNPKLSASLTKNGSGFDAPIQVEKEPLEA